MAAVSDLDPSPPPQAPGSGSAKAYEARMQWLRDAIKAVEQRERYYIDQLRQREEEEEKEKPPVTLDMVIDFINEIYYADQYWEMKQHLRELTPTDTKHADFSTFLKKLEESNKKFELDEEDVWSGVSYHIAEVNREITLKREANKRETINSELIILYGKKRTYTAAEKRSVEIMFPAIELKPRKDPNELSHPIWKLVLQARNNEYEMNTDPRLELGKETVLPLYYRHRICRKSPREYQENTVMVNVTPHTSVGKVKNLLSSCGEILLSELERGRGKRRTVYITFNDPQGAQKALEKKSLNVGGREVLIKKSEPASVRVKSNDDDPVAKDAFDKYRKLVARFARQSNDVTCVEGTGSIAVNTENAKKGVKSVSALSLGKMGHLSAKLSFKN